MSAVDDIMGTLPINDLAAQLGEDPAEVEQAVEVALPALLGGLHANAQDPAAEASIAEAVGQHDASLVDGQVDLAAVDTADGARIAHHIFGDNQDQVVRQLGGTGVSDGLVKKLIPVLAPIVLAYLAKRVGGKGGALGGGILGTILGEVLGGLGQGTTQRGTNPGSIISDVLGGLLGGGRR